MAEPDRLPLAQLPTPLVPLDRLSAELGGPQLWIKRDDLTGLELSGNKIRKLEYIVADALAAGHDTLVTEGTCQSNHCRATAAVCAKLGLHCTLLFRPPPPDRPQGNHLLDDLFGAETRSFARERFSNDRAGIVSATLDDLRQAGRNPRYTPMGASEPLGCWGYIRMMSELAEQLRAAEMTACDVVVAISSGATYAGMVLGKWLSGLADVNLLAVPVSDDVSFHRKNTVALCAQASAAFELGVEVDQSMLEFVDGYIGQGYAIPYDEAIRAIKLLAHTEAIMLDPVYTAKAFAAFLDLTRSGALGRERPAIFVHTGGIFSGFAWPELLLEGVSTSAPRTS
jgi:D-cysteine desulfhydrase